MLDRGIVAVFDHVVWDSEGFAVSVGYDEAGGRYTGLAVPQENMPPQVSDSILLARPDRATALREQEQAEQEAARAAAAAAAGAAGTGPSPGTDSTAAAAGASPEAGTTASCVHGCGV